MAKRRKTVPARKPREQSGDDEALLFRSAEALGRVIGALQRQLDEATQRLSSNGRSAATPPRGAAKSTGATKKTAGAAKTSTAKSKRAQAAHHKTRPRAAARKAAKRR
jgi:hypothetical protein